MYKQKYGNPQINTWGEAVWPQVQEKFVKDAKTGKVIVRTRDVKCLGRSENGKYFYLGPMSRLKERDKAIPSF